jgi:hypothetical protein
LVALDAALLYLCSNVVMPALFTGIDLIVLCALQIACTLAANVAATRRSHGHPASELWLVPEPKGD